MLWMLLLAVLGLGQLFISLFAAAMSGILGGMFDP